MPCTLPCCSTRWGSDPLFRGSYSYLGPTATPADVAALAQLTCLTHLDLRRQEYGSQDAHPSELVQQLPEALPMCQVLV